MSTKKQKPNKTTHKLIAFEYAGGQYRIQLPTPRYNQSLLSDYLKDGEPISFEESKVVVDSLEGYQIIKKSNVFSHYESNEGAKITREEYDKMYNEIVSKGHYDDDEDEYIFDNLDDEFELRKFNKRWSYKTKEEITYEDIVFETKKAFRSDNKYIQPLYSVTSKDMWETLSESGEYLCSYNPSEPTMFVDICKELGLTEKDYSNSTHSRIEYAQIKGSYVFTGNNNIRLGSLRSSTYEECVAQYEKDYNRIKTAVRNKLLESDMLTTKTYVNDAQLLKKLRSVLSHINAIDSKVKTQRSQNLARNEISDAIDYVFENVEVKDSE